MSIFTVGHIWKGKRDMKPLLKIFIIMGILGSVLWFTAGEYMKKMVGYESCPNGHCSKNGRFQCE